MRRSVQITVDGDTSTNDTVIGLCSGAAGLPTITSASSPEAALLQSALTALLQVGAAARLTHVPADVAVRWLLLLLLLLLLELICHFGRHALHCPHLLTPPPSPTTPIHSHHTQPPTQPRGHV
jgi:hypothetical protein